MIDLYVFGSIVLFVLFSIGADYLRVPYPERHRAFPKGHIHEYDPDGIYTYKHQNPRYR